MQVIPMKRKENEPMRNHTTWQIGGPVDLLLQPESTAELQQALQEAKALEKPYYIIGAGSNLLVPDEGLRATVIALGGSLCNWYVDGNTIVAEAGLPLPVLARKAARAGLSGLEFAAGIPGSVGGAVVMNAGAYQSQMSNVIESVLCCDTNGNLLELNNQSCRFAYRDSRFKKDSSLIILSVTFRLQPGDPMLIEKQMGHNTAARVDKQPTSYPNAGSVFKNPPGEAAGRLIERIGAKGWRQGDAMVSDKHANFIINVGTATCTDVLLLIARIKQAVYEEMGIALEEEILYLGHENL